MLTSLVPNVVVQLAVDLLAVVSTLGLYRMHYLSSIGLEYRLNTKPLQTFYNSGIILVLAKLSQSLLINLEIVDENYFPPKFVLKDLKWFMILVLCISDSQTLRQLKHFDVIF